MSSIKDFLSQERLNPETIDEIERIEEEVKKGDRSKMIYKGFEKKSMILGNLKQHVFFVMKLEIMIL